MFLRPQHFQSADRHWHEVIATADQFDHAYYYGLVNVSINEKALANFQLEIVGCQARMHDGTLLSFDASHVERIDLGQGLNGPKGLDKVFVDHDSVTVFLCVPKFVEGRANVAQPNNVGNGNASRYVAYQIERDEEAAGGNRQPISFRDVNVRILLSTDDRNGYDCLPLLRLRQSSKEDSTLVLDNDYFPPCLVIQAWPELYFNVVRAIYDMIAQQVDKLSTILINRQISWSNQHPGDLEKMYLAGVLNEAVGTLNCLAFAQGVHPFVAYTALCQIIGRLSILGPEKKAPDFPKYDHDDLANIFKWAMRTIEKLIYQMPDELVETRWFVGVGSNKLQVNLDPKWLTREWTLYLGIRSASKTVREIEEVLKSSGLDWRFGSVDQVDDIFRDRKTGVRFDPVAQTPSPLADRGNWLFFSISPIQGADYWEHCRLTNSLAARIADQQIFQHRIEQRELVVQLGGQLISFEFAMFAVRNRL